MSLTFWLICAACIACLVRAIPIDNGVRGVPRVTCGLHGVRADLDTERLFGGRLYVKGEFGIPGCSRNFFGGPPLQGAPLASKSRRARRSNYDGPVGETVGFELPFGHCHMRRIRTLVPRGVEYSFTLVISFHALFVTKVDRAYRIRCFYMEAEKPVVQQLQVAMLATEQAFEQLPMPTSASYLYGILVRSCFVDDGHGNKVELIDSRGCALDKHIVPPLIYDASLITAFTESHVFKFADKPSLFFSCVVVLCLKHDGGCAGITPPVCNAPLLPKIPVVAPAPYPNFPVPPPYVLRDQPVVVPSPADKKNGTQNLNVKSANNNNNEDDNDDVVDGESSELPDIVTKNATFFSREKRDATKVTSSHVARESKARTFASTMESDVAAEPLMILPFDETDLSSGNWTTTTTTKNSDDHDLPSTSADYDEWYKKVTSAAARAADFYTDRTEKPPAEMSKFGGNDNNDNNDETPSFSSSRKSRGFGDNDQILRDEPKSVSSSAQREGICLPMLAFGILAVVVAALFVSSIVLTAIAVRIVRRKDYHTSPY